MNETEMMPLNLGVYKAWDNKGRLLLPMELMRKLGISPGDSLTILYDSTNRIIGLQRKDLMRCVFCNTSSDILLHFKEKWICFSCMEDR